MSDRPHKKLKLWQMAMELVVKVYTLTKSFPRDEEFGLKAQLRRAIVSVPSNIAEGLTRSSKKEKLHFLNIAQASLSEADAQSEIALRLGYLSREEYEKVESEMSDVQKYLSGLSRSLR
ncbi:MAG: four helix bundle protein [Ignavibacteria bacterium]|nr:four helix bundle protein [Ignavibacteria bacterium]